MKEGDEFEKEGYEKSPRGGEKELKRENKDNLSFEVEFDRYDSRGNEIADIDLYPVKIAIPPRNRPKPPSEDEFSEEFEDENNDEDDDLESEDENDKEGRYLQR